MAENKEFKTGLLVSASPHLVTGLDTSKTMMYVAIALLFPTAAATFFFGIGAIIRVVLGAAFAVLAEYCYEKIMKQTCTVRDFSAVVTGMILALNVPANLPVWMLAIGCGVSIVIVKCLYGGLGKNIANPALVGRVVLLLSWTTAMTTWPLTRLQKAGIDAVTGATPLGELAEGIVNFKLSDLFIGNVGGAMGETCAIAVLIGGAFLIWKKIISPIIPGTFIGTVFVISLAYYAIAGVPGEYGVLEMALYQVLSGGVLFGAFFCATDYVTSPVLKKGKIIFGIGCGAVTMMIRLIGSYPEGVSFAILFMNILSPLITILVENQEFGIAAAEKAAKKAAKEAAKAPAEEKKEGANA